MNTGIVGGADGPTVIFVTGSLSGSLLLLGGGLLLLALVGGLLFSVAKRHNDCSLVAMFWFWPGSADWQRGICGYEA